MESQEITTHSDYIVYVDESGDHSLTSIDPNYPIFALVFCIFNKSEYANIASPELQNFKFAHFGHDMTVLHEHEIRKPRNDFRFLNVKERRKHFMSDLNRLILKIPFTIIAAVIDKRLLGQIDLVQAAYSSPYHLALQYCMERLQNFLESNNRSNGMTHIIVESRGKREDNELELEFFRIRDGKNYTNTKMNLSLRFASKYCNSCGLQLADLVARPIGLSVLRPNQTNRAYEILKPKFRKSPNGKIEGWGLKTYP